MGGCAYVRAGFKTKDHRHGSASSGITQVLSCLSQLFSFKRSNSAALVGRGAAHGAGRAGYLAVCRGAGVHNCPRRSHKMGRSKMAAACRAPRAAAAAASRAGGGEGGKGGGYLAGARLEQLAQLVTQQFAILRSPEPLLISADS
jgi:hypothetical protein